MTSTAWTWVAAAAAAAWYLGSRAPASSSSPAGAPAAPTPPRPPAVPPNSPTYDWRSTNDVDLWIASFRASNDTVGAFTDGRGVRHVCRKSGVGPDFNVDCG